MKIIRHNIEADSGHSSYHMAINNFTDLTHQEFRKLYTGFIKINDRPKHNVRKVDAMIDELPTSVDWRQKGIVTSVKIRNNVAVVGHSLLSLHSKHNTL